MDNLRYWIITRDGDTLSATFEEAAWRRDLSAAMGERVKRGMRRRAEMGLPTGAVPLGYQLRRDRERTWVEVDPVAGPLITELFEMAASGKHSLRQVLAVVSEKGLRSARKKPLGISTLRWVLRNPFYLGQVRLGDRTHAGGHRPLTDRRTFEQADQTLAKRRKR